MLTDSSVRIATSAPSPDPLHQVRQVDAYLAEQAGFQQDAPGDRRIATARRQDQADAPEPSPTGSSLVLAIRGEGTPDVGRNATQDALEHRERFTTKSPSVQILNSRTGSSSEPARFLITETARRTRPIASK